MTKKRKGKKKVAPRTRNDNTMTEADYFRRIRQCLRNEFRWWKPMLKALKLASRKSRNKSNPRLKFEYQCAKCKNWFPRTEVQIDHIVPCGILRSYEDIVPFIKNLTKEDSNSYQVLCGKDHLAKTKAEKEKRSKKNE